MAIAVEHGESVPALIYDQFFLEDMRLTQKRIEGNADQPKYRLHVTYRMYAVDADNKRHYKQGVSALVIEDYFAEGMKKYMEGDPDLMNAAGAIELALAKIIEDQVPAFGAAVVV